MNIAYAQSPLAPQLRPSVYKNRLLAALPEDSVMRLLPFLEIVPMPVGMIIYEARDRFAHVYFPIDCIVSLEYVLEDGRCAEVSVVGNEGLIGISSVLGGHPVPSRAVIYFSGSAYRLPSSCLLKEAHGGRELLAVILRYTKTLIIQLSQISLCNRYHDVEQQLCRFFLMTLDRVPETSLKITQDQIASMLGVRRESITKALTKLRTLGAIRQTRGNITVLNRTLLEGISCECYDAIRRETDRLIPPA